MVLISNGERLCRRRRNDTIERPPTSSRSSGSRAPSPAANAAAMIDPYEAPAATVTGTPASARVAPTPAAKADRHAQPSKTTARPPPVDGRAGTVG